MKVKIYLLPGTMCNQKLWHKLTSCAKSDSQHEIEYIHIPIPANKSFMQIATWLNSNLSEDKVFLLGFSLGGYIASYFAVNYPDRIKGLFIVGNSPCELSTQERLQRQELLNFVTTNTYKGISNKRALQLLDSNNPVQEDVNTIKKMDAELGVEELISQMSYTTERDDLLEPLSKLKSIITFYYNEQDVLINPSWLKQLEVNNPNCKLVSTKGNGHMLPLEKPEELHQLIVKAFTHL